VEFAKKISNNILNIESVKDIRAMAIGGSVARGYADEYSDLEILIFWEILPSEDTRKLIIKELGAEFFRPYNHESGEDNLTIKGFRIDLWHISLQAEEEIIKTVMNDFKIDFGSSNAIDTIRACIPLYGEDIINIWKTKVTEYPKEIMVQSIKEVLETIDISQIDLYLYRNNMTILYEQIINLQKKIFLILLALNKEFFPTYKWMYKAFKNFIIKPKNIEQRFINAFESSPKEALKDTIKILKETLDIVNKLYPEIDTNILSIKCTRKAVYSFDDSCILQNLPNNKG
jgi:predicted nucleotidyltransferase